MSIQNLDFGTASDNDGETPYTAWPKVQANFEYIDSVLSGLSTVYQPLDTDLTAIAALTTTAFGRGLLSLTSAAAVQSYVGVRENLTANRTYYVRTDGSNSNNGLTNSAGGAFLTVQKAVNVALALDMSVYNVTIQIAAGTYAGAVSVSRASVGSGNITLLGDTTTPSNVVISNTITVGGAGSKLLVAGLHLTGANGLVANDGGYIGYAGQMSFACSSIDMWANGSGATINFAGAVYTTAGNKARHAYAIGESYIQLFTAQITVSGTPAYSVFVDCQRLSLINAGSMTITGPATGVRFSVSNLGVINTGGGGASYFPGGTAGVGTNPGTSPYGLYI